MNNPRSLPLRINGQRLWQSLMDLAEIGATPKGGNCRLALSEEDRLGRELVTGWLRDAGLTLRIDQIGNIFAHRPGRRDDLPPVVAGSHIDTQPTGGRFDGCYGVLAGLEIMRVLDEQDITTEAPLIVVIWTNEEGCRFVPSMMGSAVYTGRLSLDEALATEDRHGDSVADSLSRTGYAGPLAIGSPTFGAYFEAHIEQGPVLEAEGITIGAVTGSLGLRWFDVVVTGQEAHAGPTPMPYRRDALKSAVAMLSEILALADPHQPKGRVTCGELTLHPNSRNVIPGQVRFSVDIRHLKADVLNRMEQGLREICERHARPDAITVKLHKVQDVAPTPFDNELVNLVRHSSQALKIPYRDIETGAGHDAVLVSQVAPTAMIFVPCEGGISHNESEYASPEDLTDGANVLLQAILGRAGVAEQDTIVEERP